MGLSHCCTAPATLPLHCLLNALPHVLQPQDGDVSTRLGAASALRGLAGDLGDAEVTAALDFLIRNGLADPHDKVRWKPPCICVTYKVGWMWAISYVTS
jgi:hypothetical protein